MKAVMYGAGNIGRGFIGPLFAKAGYKVVFVDVADRVVQDLHRRGSYPVRIVSGEGFRDEQVTGVDAVHGSDTQAVADAIAKADIAATAVGVHVLERIVPNLVAGIRRRFAATDAPLNILICENLMDADKALAGMLKAQLTADEAALFDARIGLVKTSIGRMVPAQTAEMQAGDSLRVCVERYGFLPVDWDAFKGEIPDIPKMIPESPFDFYSKRKLYLHNTGHAVCAYLGLYTGRATIDRALDDPFIRLLVRDAMSESIAALSLEYGVPMLDIQRHADDLLFRFANRALGDTCRRVGGDPARKLGPSDRLIGAAALCQKQGIPPVAIAAGAAAALRHHLGERELPQDGESAAAELCHLSGLERGDELAGEILAFYAMLREGADLERLHREVQQRKERAMPQVI